MKVKELKAILNSRADLDECKVRIEIIEDGCGTTVPLEYVEGMLCFCDSYDGATIYLGGCWSEEDRKDRDKYPTYQELQIEEL